MSGDADSRLWVAYAKTYTYEGRWTAEGGVKSMQASDCSPDTIHDLCVSASQAWSAAERTLRSMAAECIAEADRCHARSVLAREKEVASGVA